MDKKEQKNLLTGLFVISGVVLLLVLLFFLGLSDLFAQKIALRTGFTESVQGLNRGSAVKYRGVQIGTVKDITILVTENIIQIDMEIEPGNFAVNRRNHTFSEREFRKFFNAEIRKKGLRARLEMLGITGMRYIDFDYFAAPDTEPPVQPRFSGKDGVIYIPAVTSQLKDVTTTLTTAVDRLSKIRFERISEQLETALVNLGQLLGSEEIRSTITRINETAENLETSSRAISHVLSEERIQKLVSQFEQTLTAVKDLKNSLQQIADASEIPDTTLSIRQMMENISDRRQEFSDVLAKVDQTLEAIRILADTLSADPASLLRGKNKNTNGEKP